MKPLQFTVSGLAAPQGSKRAVGRDHSGRTILVESSKRLPEWRRDVRLSAIEARAGRPTIRSAARLTVEFSFPRPATHYRSGRYAHLVRPSAPAWPTSASKGDLDKLVRGVCDALTAAGVWVDDKLAVEIVATKRFTEGDEIPAATITVEALEDAQDAHEKESGA